MSRVDALVLYVPLYVIAGAVAGLLAGLFGLGGGVILVPVLLWLFAWQGFPPEIIAVTAVATSLATIVVTGLSSVLAHHRLGSLDWAVARALIPGIVVGAILGAWVADRLPGTWLETTFALYLLLVALQMTWRWQPRPGAEPPRASWLAGAGSVIGMAAAMLGIGGGTLTVPLLVRWALPMRTAVAVSSAAGLPLAAAGTASYGVLGWDAPGLPPGSLGYVYLPAFLGIVATSILTAPVGARLAHQVPAQTLKRLFAVILALIALRILLRG
ncbi:conserved hypothetical protein [Methylomarinovum tepidoasis]|uniref:Probable membrane transporter protein n=1 Tax=Methylomarinovum tepidoasis TaxID=2840183 RepID=A0AAU9C7V1_9GAMM|nr:sulfite exporter TauE/SafE family protein [Methylomarinovum sp. IN45]BCX89742.1 conserved hypothetical protein [Methylomarinovum sp. IN45]